MIQNEQIPLDIILDFSSRSIKGQETLVGCFHRKPVSYDLPDLESSSNTIDRETTNATSVAITGSSPKSFSIWEHVSRGSLADVYRGAFDAEPTCTKEDSSKLQQSLIVKVAMGTEGLDSLQHETIMYQHAPPLQGVVIPRCYGYYTNEQNTAAFLLLEDCGRPYDSPIRVLPDRTKLAILQALKKAHDAGLEHGDLEPWNLLDYNGSPRIVDWHLGLIHTCADREKIMTEEFCNHEAIQELMCDELASIGEEMKFRSHNKIMYSPSHS